MRDTWWLKEEWVQSAGPCVLHSSCSLLEEKRPSIMQQEALVLRTSCSLLEEKWPSTMSICCLP